MEADQWTQIERLFQRARTVGPDQREAVLREHCDDPAVRAEVASLLSARAEAPAFFAAAAREVAVPMLDELDSERVGAEASDLSGQAVGGYRLVEEIGVGGMGVVYRAERTEADFEQTVAVKFLRRRLHAAEAAERFRAERQVLARLDHPHVARLIDGGVTEDGRPYLVMEHVEGTPITNYVDKQDLGVEGRLDLLGQICDAVEAAHRQLVVHRDLKPSNVLVAEAADGTPQVKLLDFGIAKLLDDSFPVTRLQTRTGQQLMTPAYAAPEQVTGDEITTATDVYQLGVLAYELFSGRRPFDPTDKSLTEIERILLEETPEKPSAVADTSAAQLRGDLDTIVLKALRKEPGRRYGSVEALATDLERYQDGEPVEARPATLGYRAKKFVGRHRWGVATVVSVIAVVVVGGLLLLQQRNRAQRNARWAREEAETARQVSAALVDLFETADPYERTDTLTARTLLRRGERQLAQLEGQPALRARVLGGMGRAYRGLGEYRTADSLHEKALNLRGRLHDEPHPAVATSLHNLGRVRQERGRYAVAGSLQAAALAMRRRLYEPPHPKIARSLHHRASVYRAQERYEAADSLYREALSMRRSVYDQPHHTIAATLNDLGLVWEEQDRYAAADSVYREALSIERQTLGPKHLRTATTLGNLASLQWEWGQYAAADSLYRKVLSIKRKRLGTSHPNTSVTLNNLGLVLKARGDYQAADSMYREALSVDRQQLGGGHPSLATTLGNLASLQEERGRYAAADSLYQEELSVQRARWGTKHPEVAATLSELAHIQKRRGRYASADSLYRRALSIQRETLGPMHPDVAGTLNDRAIVLRMQDKPVAADSMYQKALAIKRKRLGPKHPRIATSLNNRAVARWDRGDYTGADSLYQEALAIRRAKLGPEDPRTATTMHNWAYTLKAMGQTAAADSLFRRALTLRRDALGKTHVHVADSHVGLALLRRDQGDYDAAEHHFRRALSIRRRVLRADHPEIQKVTRRLAELYDRRGRPEQARPYQITRREDGSEL